MGGAGCLDLDAGGVLAADVGGMRLVVGGALDFAFAWTAEAAVTTWFVVWPGLLGRRIFDC